MLVAQADLEGPVVQKASGEPPKQALRGAAVLANQVLLRSLHMHDLLDSKER